MKYSILALLFYCCISCNSPQTMSEYRDLPEVKFALSEIEKSLEKSEVEFNLDQINFRLDSLGMEEQEYSVVPLNRSIEITGGGARGLMYGGFEVAEQIALYGQVKACAGTPYIEKRGIKFNIPLDARTPSYDDSGDAAQENIAEMWSWDFWEEFLDQMALNRYNVLSLWNPHPFPSMIKLEDYPDVALDDVCRTTLEPVGKENEWGDPGLVTSNVMDNLEILLEISIDEKIKFWQKVMKHASERGIDIYWINWNICPNSVAPPVKPYYKTYEINLHSYEEGKHGITYEISNPVTIDYYRKAVKTFLLTYPQVKGIGVTAGEHMPLSWGGYNREKWLWETYGQGILDAKKEDPGRTVDFIHRVWHSDMEQIMTYWKDYPDPFEVSFKYAKARLYSSPDLKFADSHVEEMKPYGLKSWWNLRNDDIFVYRWGDPDYVRDFLRNMPSENSAGYYMGSDGYVWGREFISKDAQLAGQLEIHKHWYSFMLWGRLGYNPKLDDPYFINSIENRYGLDNGSELYETWRNASRIIPLVNVFHWRDWDHHWSVESCQARPKLGGYRDVFDFMDNPTLENSGLLNPKEFVSGKKQGAISGSISPLDVADRLNMLADGAIKSLELLSDNGGDVEYRAVLDDIRAQAFLGRFYASKIRASVNLSYYRETKNSDEKEKAIELLEESYTHWLDYAEVSERNYNTQMLARTNVLDWSALAENIRNEIELVKNYFP